jgi:predicted transcriptional regulator
MAKETLTVRLDAELRDNLDQIALSVDRDRSYVVTEDLRAYVDLHAHQLKRIRQGLREANAGKFVPETEVEGFLGKFRKR